jgi:scyllo-inositol 2-dehydrogenase (NADP+)
MRNRIGVVLLSVLAVYLGPRGFAGQTAGAVGRNPAEAAIPKNPAKAGSHVRVGDMQAGADRPLRLAIGGLVHGHVRGFLRALSGRTDVELVGIADPDAALSAAVARQHELDTALAYASLDDMLDRAKPDAVAAFTSTLDHPAVVEACARRRVAVMMEKPLAVSVADGERIRRAATAGGIPVVVNYETTWYPGLVAAAQAITADRASGAIRKIVAMDGHEGPKEIGVGPEFLAWLTDPVRNGAGALFDFGCYGANLMTWLMDNERPHAVTAITQQLKPAVYPHVDDEATVLVEYAGAQGIIQASWNWPFGRKDLEIYTEGAYAISTGPEDVRLRLPGGVEQVRRPGRLPDEESDPVSYLIAVARGRVRPSGRSSLENNLIVTEILAAARESANTGRRVVIDSRP